MAPSRCCVLFSKPAEPGKVKTRLQPVLTADQAAELHQAFLDDLVPRLARGDFELEIAWAVEAGQPLPEAPGGSLRQYGADLGERLYHGLAEVARRYARVAAVGSDHPELTAQRVSEGFERLEAGADVVLGPAHDGGYYLIGLSGRRLSRRLFAGIDWGTDRVLSTTLERCRDLGLEASLLPAGLDVDVPEDLEQLVKLVRSGDPSCPNTARVLRGWGRLP